MTATGSICQQNTNHRYQTTSLSSIVFSQEPKSFHPFHCDARNLQCSTSIFRDQMENVSAISMSTIILQGTHFINSNTDLKNFLWYNLDITAESYLAEGVRNWLHELKA